MNTITLQGRKVTRDDVLQELRLCDLAGKVAYLGSGTDGYRDSVRYHLRHDGHSYPSKAILGRAAGLNSRDFFGGAAHTAAQLKRLGFEVRHSETGELLDPSLDAMRKRCVAAGLEVGEDPWPETAVPPSAYFCSGSNQPGEIRGLSRAGADIGVSCDRLAKDAEHELYELAGSDINVFVDSGAFTEVTFVDGRRRVVKPITYFRWAEILDTYCRLANRLGTQLWVVAPDAVGCQTTTLQRLRMFAGRLRYLNNRGVRVLVPMQKGVYSQELFAGFVAGALEFQGWIPALPCKKAASTPQDVKEFMATVGQFVPHVHMLGLGIRNPKLSSYLAPFADGNTSVSLDSCWVRTQAGRTNGPGGGPRALTRARDFAKDILGEAGGTNVIALATYMCWALDLGIA